MSGYSLFYRHENVDFLCDRALSFCNYSSYLCDVTLKSEDGKEFPCHKSVLCARLGTMHPSIKERSHKQIFSFIHIDRKCCFFWSAS